MRTLCTHNSLVRILFRISMRKMTGRYAVEKSQVGDEKERKRESEEEEDKRGGRAVEVKNMLRVSCVSKKRPRFLQLNAASKNDVA